jgi:hypothetical protein
LCVFSRRFIDQLRNWHGLVRAKASSICAREVHALSILLTFATKVVKSLLHCAACVIGNMWAA